MPVSPVADPITIVVADLVRPYTTLAGLGLRADAERVADSGSLARVVLDERYGRERVREWIGSDRLLQCAQPQESRWVVPAWQVDDDGLLDVVAEANARLLDRIDPWTVFCWWGTSVDGRCMLDALDDPAFLHRCVSDACDMLIPF